MGSRTHWGSDEKGGKAKDAGGDQSAERSPPCAQKVGDEAPCQGSAATGSRTGRGTDPLLEPWGGPRSRRHLEARFGLLLART